MTSFLGQEMGWISEAAVHPDPDRGMEMLREHFTGFRLAEACQEADRMRAAQQAREAEVRDSGVWPVSDDLSQILESYDDGTYLARDAPAEATGRVLSSRTAQRATG